MTTTERPALTRSLIERLTAAHAALRRSRAGVAEAQADLGDVLAEVKRRVPHGDYTDAAAQVVPVTPAMLRRYVALSEYRAAKPMLWRAAVAFDLSVLDRLRYLRGNSEIGPASAAPSPDPFRVGKIGATSAEGRGHAPRRPSVPEYDGRLFPVRSTRRGVEVAVSPRGACPGVCRPCYVRAGDTIALAPLEPGQCYLVIAGKQKGRG